MPDSEPAVNLAYWSRMPGWRMSEAAALLLGLDPDEKLENGRTRDKCYFNLERLLKRARTMGELESPEEPIEILQWMRSNGFEVPETLAAAVTAARKRRIKNWRTRYLKAKRELKEEKKKREELPHRRRPSVYQFIYAVGRDYGFTPDNNDGATSAIFKLVEKIPFIKPISKGTVLALLTDAYEEEGKAAVKAEIEAAALAKAVALEKSKN